MEWDLLDMRWQTLSRHVERGEVGLGLGSWVGLGSKQHPHGIGGLVAGREIR